MSVDNVTRGSEIKASQENDASKAVHTYQRSKSPSVISQIKEGILSTVNSRNPQKTQSYQKFAEGTIRTLLNGFKTNHDPSNPKHIELLNKWESRVNSDVLLDESMCHMMIRDFAGTIDNKDDAKKYEAAASETIGKVFSGIEKNEIAADDMWKWQVLGVLAIASPFGFLNGVQIAMNIFGPMLGSGGIAAGTAQVSTWGPTGFIVEALRVDDGIKLVLEKTPILSDILEVLSAVTTNESVQTLGGDLAGPLAGPVVLLGIPIILATSKAPKVLEDKKSRETSDDNQKAALKKLENYPKNQESGGKRNIGDVENKDNKESKNSDQENQKSNSPPSSIAAKDTKTAISHIDESMPSNPNVTLSGGRN